jgi:hypothetical protein
MVWKPPYVTLPPAGTDAAPTPTPTPDTVPVDSGGWKPPYVTTPRVDTPPPPPTDQGDGTWSGLFHDMLNPKPADLSRPQTWRDWGTKTYSPSMSDVGNAALDDVTLSKTYGNAPNRRKPRWAQWVR